MADRLTPCLDAAHALPGPRLQRVVARSLSSGGGGPAASAALVTERLKNLVHFTTPTLPHLVALLHRPPPSFPPPGTGLLVVDSLSILIDSTYARAGPPPTPRNPRPGQSRPASASAGIPYPPPLPLLEPTS